jgi:hypothetical protein
MNIGGWLRSLGLGKYEPAFRENDIDETVLPSLTAEDLNEKSVRSALVGLLAVIAALHLIVGEPSGLLFFSHRRTPTPSRACSKPPRFQLQPGIHNG